MDSIRQVFDSYANWLEHMPAQDCVFVFRVFLLLVIPFLCAKFTFRKGNRSDALQVFSGLLGFFFAVLFPIDWVIHIPTPSKGILITLSIFITLVLPRVMPFYFRPKASQQLVIMKSLYGFVLVAYFYNFMLK